MAGIDLPTLAEDNGWTVTERVPADFFGDVRVRLSVGGFVTVTLVYGPSGSLAGGYLRDSRKSCWWHTERVGVARNWILAGEAVS